MDRFIKLHLASDGAEFWLRIGTIAGFVRKDQGTCVFETNCDDGGWTARETPAEILALIEQRAASPTVDDDGCCDVCGRDLHGCAACSGYVDPENIRETRGGEKA